MKNFVYLFICFTFLITSAYAQDPGKPKANDILSEDNEVVKKLKEENPKFTEAPGTKIEVQKKRGNEKKIEGSYIVTVKDEFIKPFAKTRGRSSSRKAEIAAANKHEAQARKAIREYATKTLGIGNDEIGEIFTGAISGFVVKLKDKKKGPKFQDDAKKENNIQDVIQDAEVSLADYSMGGVISASSAKAVAQYNSWGTWVAGGCDCTGYSKWIWILDTGIDLNHPDLNVNTSYDKSFISTESSAEDLHGHGTHVAGIAAAKNNSYGSRGIAYGARVVPVKVLNRYGSGSWSGIIAGLNWAYKYGIAGDVVNMSLGGGANSTVDNAVKAVAAKGIYVVMAAGNSSANANNHSPARANGSKMYTIAATSPSPFWWSHTFASYSNYGKPPVDFAAPGTSIYSTYKNGGYATMSGTSMATPNFSGALLCGTKLKKGYYYYHVNPSSHSLYVIRPKT